MRQLVFLLLVGAALIAQDGPFRPFGSQSSNIPTTVVLKGPAYLPSGAAVINALGTLDKASGPATNCLLVNGGNSSCGSGGSSGIGTLTNGDWCNTDGTLVNCGVTPITNTNQLINGSGFLTTAVTSVATNNGLTGGAITTTGTLGLASIAAGGMLCNTGTTSQPPTIGNCGISVPESVTGTTAVSASSPLALNATTGNLTCSTCATTTNGGALSATSPVTISAAGVIACATCVTSSPTFETNTSNNSSQTTLNLLNSAATDGLTLTVTNTSAGNVQLGFTGTLTNAGLTNSSVTINTTGPLAGGAAVSLGGSLTLTCTTCATTTNGGALTATSPVTISAAGVIACATCAVGTITSASQYNLAYYSAATTINAIANGTAKQLLVAGSPDNYIDYPDVKIVPAAVCNAGTAGPGWTLPSSNGLTAACRAGTNNLLGALQGTPNAGTSQYAMFDFELPNDWDTATQPYVQIFYASGANTSGTVIFTVSTACMGAEAGGTTDDPSFNANSAFSTQTMATANRAWAISGQLTTVTSGNACDAGSNMIVKIVLSGTASSAVNIYKATVTTPRLLTVQAN